MHSCPGQLLIVPDELAAATAVVVAAAVAAAAAAVGHSHLLSPGLNLDNIQHLLEPET